MRSALPLALAAALAACGPSNRGHCPGRAVATLTFQEPADSPPSATCAGQAPAFSSIAPFSADLSVDPAGGTTAWLCPDRPAADPLAGTLVGDALDVASATSSAILGACGTSCAVTISEHLTGTVARGASGEITGFSGTLSDTATAADPSTCGTCGTGCVVTYPLTAP